MGQQAPAYIANFDSASAMLRATAHYLDGRDFPVLGLSTLLKPVGPAVNALPQSMRELVYALGGWLEAIPPRRIGEVRAEELSQWVVSEYPERSYPAVAIGSASGALVHLCTALNMPWLPQTFLIPVRQSGVHPDEPKRSLEAGIEPGRRLLEANPELQLHHMHDPVQDRLMVKYMSYFRVKRLRLGEAYERFLRERLMLGGTIVISDCRRSWPVTELGERHYFQHGALGGATPEEFLHGSERVAEYLERYGSHVHKWDSPEPTTEAPEAEWGFPEQLGADIEAFAKRYGFRIVRMVFDEPEHPSPLVAELHRAWFRERRIEANRLLVSSFIVMEPYWAMRTGSVPFWMKFNTEVSLEWLRAYLDEAEAYDDIHLMLFAHGVEGVGLPPLERWRELLGRARRHGAFAGVDEELFPRDFAVFSRYHDAVRRIPERHPLPEPMPLERFERFVAENEGRFPVAWKPKAGARVEREHAEADAARP
jgi:hypothetical protein